MFIPLFSPYLSLSNLFIFMALCFVPYRTNKHWVRYYRYIQSIRFTMLYMSLAQAAVTLINAYYILPTTLLIVIFVASTVAIRIIVEIFHPEASPAFLQFTFGRKKLRGQTGIALHAFNSYRIGAIKIGNEIFSAQNQSSLPLIENETIQVVGYRRGHLLIKRKHYEQYGYLLDYCRKYSALM